MGLYLFITQMRSIYSPNGDFSKILAEIFLHFFFKKMSEISLINGKAKTAVSLLIRSLRTNCIEVALFQDSQVYTTQEKTKENVALMDKLAANVDDLKTEEKLADFFKKLKEGLVVDLQKQFIDGKEETLSNYQKYTENAISEIASPYIEKNPAFQARFKSAFNLMKKSLDLTIDTDVRAIINRPLLMIMPHDEIQPNISPEFEAVLRSYKTILKLKSNLKLLITTIDKVLGIDQPENQPTGEKEKPKEEMKKATESNSFFVPLTPDNPNPEFGKS
jgi:Zn-dependent M32 family carboxypeptidase